MDPAKFVHIPAPKEKQTAMGWEVNPDGFYDIVTRVHREYKPAKIFITENGASYPDGPDAAGKVHDVKRIEYLQGHIGAIGRAIRDGAPVAGLLRLVVDGQFRVGVRLCPTLWPGVYRLFEFQEISQRQRILVQESD